MISNQRMRRRSARILRTAALALVVGLSQEAGADVLYVADSSGIVTVDSGNGATRSLLARSGLKAMFGTPSGAVVYATVVADRENSLIAVDMQSGRVLTETTLPGTPWSAALSHDGSALWVKWSGTEWGFSAFETPSLQPFGSIRPAARSGHLATGIDGATGYEVELGLGGSIVAYDARTLKEVGRAGALYQASGRLAVHPNGRTVYNFGWEFGPFVQTTEFDPTAPSGDRYGGVKPPELINMTIPFSDIAFRSDGSRAYLLHGDRILVLDTTVALDPEMIRMIEGIGFVTSIVVLSSSEDELFLAGSSSGSPAIAVLELQTGRITRTLALDAPANAVVVAPGGTPTSLPTTTATMTPTPLSTATPTTTPTTTPTASRSTNSGSGGCQLGSAPDARLVPLLSLALLGLFHPRRPRKARDRYS